MSEPATKPAPAPSPAPAAAAPKPKILTKTPIKPKAIARTYSARHWALSFTGSKADVSAAIQGAKSADQTTSPFQELTMPDAFKTAFQAEIQAHPASAMRIDAHWIQSTEKTGVTNLHATIKGLY